MDARDLTTALGGEWHGHHGIAPCPFCQPERRHDQRALSIKDGATRVLVHCHKGGCDARDILRGHGPCEPSVMPPTRKTTDRSAVAQRVWHQSQPITGTIAEAYLRGRGITCDLPTTLRFHPECWHGPTSARHPAMVALVEGGEGFAVHRTFLRLDGTKASLSGGSKLMLGSTAGGAVRLVQGDGPLVVAEGVETGLSLASGLLRAPATVWASLSTSGMRALSLPKTPDRLTVASDGDAAGRGAAHDLATRATSLGWRVSLLPAPGGLDWNDVLREGINHG
jgi:phage/plasmid primase-like uncharacterized protein